MGLLFKLLLSFYRKSIPTGFWRMSPSGTILLVKFSLIDTSQVPAGRFFWWPHLDDHYSYSQNKKIFIPVFLLVSWASAPPRNTNKDEGNYL